MTLIGAKPVAAVPVRSGIGFLGRPTSPPQPWGD